MTSDLRAALRGVMVPLVTPFDERLEVDWSGFRRHITWLLNEGVSVLLVADLVGEAWALTAAEKAASFEHAVRSAEGRARTVAKISEPAFESACWLAEAARDAGVDAVKVVLPHGIRPEDDEAYAYLVEIAEASGLPFLVEANGSDVSLALLDRLLLHPRFVGVEETSLDLDRFAVLVQRYGQRVPVIAGSEDVLGFTLLLGAAGFMTATPNFAPEFMHRLWQAGAAQDAATTLRLYEDLRRFRRLLAHDLAGGRPVFASYAKAALELIGRPAGPPRLPLRAPTPAERARLAVVLQESFGLTVHGPSESSHVR